MWELFETHGIVCVERGGGCGVSPLPHALLPGSFNPLHRGHVGLAAAATARLGVPVAFELSLVNVDKPELARDEVERRAAQFVGIGSLWLTRAATFAEKAALFPGAAFVVGHDTAVRLIDPKYYRGDPALRDETLRTLMERGCRVLVGGRVDDEGRFRIWERAAAEKFADLFLPLAESDFRDDVSSTLLREAARR